MNIDTSMKSIHLPISFSRNEPITFKLLRRVEMPMHEGRIANYCRDAMDRKAGGQSIIMSRLLR